MANADNVLQKGARVIPLEETDSCFHSSDPDTDDEVPVWVEEICLKDLIPNIDTKQLYPLRKPGIGKMSFMRSTNFKNTKFPSI